MALKEEEKKEDVETTNLNSDIQETTEEKKDEKVREAKTEKNESSKTNQTENEEPDKKLVVAENKQLTTKPQESKELSTIETGKNGAPTISNQSSGRKVAKIVGNTFLILVALIILAFTVFTVIHIDNSKISKGVSILGIDVAELERDAATEKISQYVNDKLNNNDILLKHNDFQTNIGPEQIETKVNIVSAIDAAFDAGSGDNIFSNSFKKLALMFNPVDVKPQLSINNEQLEKTLSDISTQLPDAVKESDYYIEGSSLIITPGKAGVIIDSSAMSKILLEKLNDLSYTDGPIEIVTLSKEPDAPNIENIYKEIHKEAVDAHYDANTHVVYPEENGLDFKISLDEAKEILKEAKEEYSIPLKTLHPQVTTNMIGMEAFPDQLSSFSTNYPASNRGRTTNLKLAASKVNGTVVLPGETFSYNGVVGERTIAAGYKEAAIYQDGQVVNGLGGGICQISSTLYNAALYANLEIVERRNHQFVPSYLGAGRDATVVYGSQDFKFKNNRKYAIKIVCSVEGGVANFQIYGLAEPDDCDVTISTSITSRGASSFTSATFKTLRRGGEVVSQETISRDTYKVH